MKFRPVLLPLFLLALASSLTTPRECRADVPPDLSLIWGSLGSGNGQFSTPTGITVDENGFVYVCESANNRVQKFDGDGNFITKWGSLGSSTGKFNQPHGIHADKAGYIYVADSNNHRIQKFTTTGAFVSAFGAQGTGNGQFSIPRGVTTDPGGNIYVADTGNNRIQKFTDAGVFLQAWGSAGIGDGQMLKPNGIDIDNLGRVYVTELDNHRVQVFTSTGAFVRKWGTLGSGDGNFDYPMGIVVLGTSAYVVSNNAPRIQKFTNTGTFLTKWGQFGSTPPDFNSPRGMDADESGNLYIVDSGNHRIKKYGSGPTMFENVLSVGSGRGLPALGPVSIPVDLNSFETASALEIRIADTPDWFHVTRVTTTGRASAMTASFSDGNAGVHVLVYNTAGGSILPGAGPILNLTGTIDPGAVVGDSTVFDVAVVLMANASGLPASISGSSGVLLIERIAGDVNGDNFLDAGDIVRLIEIILGKGAPPTPDETHAADCNGDNEVNVFDVKCLIDLILGVPASPGGELSPLARNLVDLSLDLKQDVKAIQFTLPAGVSTETAGGLGSFEVRFGSDASGRTLVMAFDPQGGSWETGVRTPLRLGADPTDFRAYGAGGRSLPVTVSGSKIAIGVPVPPGLAILGSHPNPFRGDTVIRFSMDKPGPTRLSVFDVKGALVYRSEERILETGEHVWHWSPARDAGRSLPSGIYMGMIESGNTRGTLRMVLAGE